MAEFDTIFVCNPTKEDFSVNFNGEPYKIEAGGQRQYVIAVALHFAKHLSDKILQEEFKKKRTKKDYQANPKLRENDPEKTAYTMLDNSNRRIWLYKILKKKVAVEDVIKKYPQFKFKDSKQEFSFIGNIKEYDDFVAKEESTVEEKTTPPTKED